MPRKIQVFLDELPWDIRSRNTDWRYVRFDLPRLSDFDPSLCLTPQRSHAISLAGNVKTIRAAVGRRVGLPLTEYALTTSRLSAAALRHSNADIIFAHRAFPLNAGSKPVVWQSAIIDPVMQSSYGVSDQSIAEQIAVKGPLFARCAAVQVSTQAEAKRHAMLFPQLADRFVAIPFFTPGVKPCEPEALERHLHDGPVRILFVGNHARRKGLDLLLEAFLQLPPHVQSQTRLTVVSNFDRSPMELPSHANITYVRGMAHREVLAEMAHSHLLVNVARLESYGLIFVEAMAEGMVCLGPQWEVQRELFQDGEAGVNLACDASAIADSLQTLILSPALRHRIGTAALQRFRDHYAPAVVARRYCRMFTDVLAQRMPGR